MNFKNAASDLDALEKTSTWSATICVKAQLTVQRSDVQNRELKFNDEQEEGNVCLESWHEMPGFQLKRRYHEF